VAKHPNDLDWKREDIVTVKNIRKEDYIFSYDGMRYAVRAGQEREFPGYIAWAFVKHLTDLLMQEGGDTINMTNELARKVYSDKLVVKVSKLQTIEEEETLDEVALMEQGAMTVEQLEEIAPEQPEEPEGEEDEFPDLKEELKNEPKVSTSAKK
jgi:hypothetical protein